MLTRIQNLSLKTVNEIYAIIDTKDDSICHVDMDYNKIVQVKNNYYNNYDWKPDANYEIISIPLETRMHISETYKFT